MTRLSKHQKIGFQGEQWAIWKLQQLGYDPEYMPWETPNCDLKIDNLPVEVKLALPTWRKHHGGVWKRRWQFHIAPTAAQMVNEWLLILIAQDAKGYKHPFILPGSAIQDRRHLQITSHPSKYRGWLSYWLNQWSIIDSLLKRQYGRLVELERLAA